MEERVQRDDEYHKCSGRLDSNTLPQSQSDEKAERGGTQDERVSKAECANAERRISTSGRGERDQRAVPSRVHSSLLARLLA